MRRLSVLIVLLACVVPVRGDIILTPDQNVDLWFTSPDFDLNADGLVDLRLGYTILGTPEGTEYYGRIAAYIWGDSMVLTDGSDAALPAGVMVSETPATGFEWKVYSPPLPTTSQTVSDWNEPPFSGWSGALSLLSDAYVGVSFEAADGTHYGWLNVYLEPDGDHGRPKVRGWAYESDADVPIVMGAVPEPGVLAFLVLGSALLLCAPTKHGWRTSASKSTAN